MLLNDLIKYLRENILLSFTIIILLLIGFSSFLGTLTFYTYDYKYLPPPSPLISTIKGEIIKNYGSNPEGDHFTP